MAELFEAAQPFEISSPVIFDVPPQTAQTNIINASQVDQFKIRPDRQFIRQNTLSAATASRNISSDKSFFITKIMLGLDTTNSTPGTWFSGYTTLVSSGATVESIFILRNGTSTSVFKDFKNIDFNPPLFINTQNGRIQFTLAQTGLVAPDIFQYTVIGFFVD